MPTPHRTNKEWGITQGPLPTLEDGRDAYVAVIAEVASIPYDDAKQKMDAALEQWGVTYVAYLEDDFFRCDSFGDLELKVQRWSASRSRVVDMVSAASGWDVEYAFLRMSEVERRWPRVSFPLFLTHAMYQMADDEIADKVEGWDRVDATRRAHVAELTGWSQDMAMFDMLRRQALFGLQSKYYMSYETWKLTDEELQYYATRSNARALYDAVNDEPDLVDDKLVFSRDFGALMGRRHWVNRDTTFESFQAFAEGLRRAFCKPAGSDQGRGVFVLDLPLDERELENTYNDLVSLPPMVLEEMIDQHPEVSAIYPKSVNTVRVMTLNHHGTVHLVAAAMRFGRLGITDNYSGSGVVSDVDLNTGRLATPAVDKKGRIYQKHPATGHRFVGFQIPHWEELRHLVEQAALSAKGADFVGWDIAICEDRVVVVEGNARPGTGLIQAPYAPYRIGRAYVFAPYQHMLDGAPLEREVACEEADFDFELTDDGAVLTGYRRSFPVVHVPEFALGKPVVEIGPGAFDGDSSLRFVRLPSTVKRVRVNAFRRCSNLQGIYLGESLRIVGARAFMGCVSLHAIVLPARLLRLRNSVFEGCTSLQEVTLPPRMKALESKTFAGCTALESVLLPIGLEGIGDQAFENCQSLNTVSYYRPKGTNRRGDTRKITGVGLPVLMTNLGAKAFKGCTSLAEVTLPAGIERINDAAFEDCSSLHDVSLHNRVRAIGSRAFAGCALLRSVRLPLGCKFMSEDAFYPKTLLRAPKGSYAEIFAKKQRMRFEATPREPSPRPISQMIPKSNRLVPFFSPVQRERAAEYFEIRPSSVEPAPHYLYPKTSFALNGDVYSRSTRKPGQARIMLLGKLLARGSQIRSAWNGISYEFGRSFRFVRSELDADLVIGSLDTLLSDHYPYNDQVELISPNGYANAPSSYATAMRAAGIDALALASNHVYDLGVSGIFDTLESLNEADLVHTGLYASTEDPRFLVFDLSGIRLSVHSFMVEHREDPKYANFTTRGHQTLFSYSNEENVEQQLASAKQRGADFSVAYCCWADSNAREVTQGQRQTAQFLADAGADLIVGTGPSHLQYYETLVTDNGREVPVLWSAGNFMSDMAGARENSLDTLILEATLEKSQDGGVSVTSVRYRPFTILDLGSASKNDYAVVQSSVTLVDRPAATSLLSKSRLRTQTLMGGAVLPAQQRDARSQRPPAVARRVSFRINTALESLRDIGHHSYNREHMCEKRELDTIVLGDASKRLGLNEYKFGPLLSVYESEGRALCFYMHMSTALTQQDRDATNDKELTREILTAAGIPVARGVLVKSVNDLGQAYRDIGAPLVVKPVAGSFGRGVRLGIESERELKDAALPILNDGENVIVEEMFLGIDLRISVVDGEARAATFRVPANVVGDGVSTVVQLVEEKNAVRSQNDYISHQTIKFTPSIIEFLDKSGMSADSVPPKGERVYLHHVANISAGGDSYEVIDQVHPDLKDLAVRTAALFPSALHAGVDILAQRLDVGLDQQRAVVCEVNLNNELPLHTHPVGGEPTALADIELAKHREKEASVIPGIPYAVNAVEVPAMDARKANRLIASQVGREPDFIDTAPGTMRAVEGRLLSDSLDEVLAEGASAKLRDGRFISIEGSGETAYVEISGNNMAARAVAKWPSVRQAIGEHYGIPTARTFHVIGEISEDLELALAQPGSRWSIRGVGRARELSSDEVINEIRSATSSQNQTNEITVTEGPAVVRCDVLMRGTELLTAQLTVPFGVLGDGQRSVQQLVAAALARREQNPVSHLRAISTNTLAELRNLPEEVSERVLAEDEWLQLGVSFALADGALLVGLNEIPIPLADYATRIAGFAASPGIMTITFGLVHGPGDELSWIWTRASSEPRLSRFAFPHYGDPYDGFEEHAAFLISRPRLRAYPVGEPEISVSPFGN